MIDLLSPMASMFAGGAGGGGGLSMPSSATSALSDRSPINIAPVGANFGAIMQPYIQGSPENGGIGGDFMRRYAGGGGSTLQAGGFATKSVVPYVLLAGGALVTLFLLMR